MTIQITDSGLQVNTFEESKDALVDVWAQYFNLTDIQRERIRTSLQSPSGNLTRIFAEIEYRFSEKLLQIYNTLTFNASGTHLDRVTPLLGVERDGAVRSEVLGTATGVAATVINDGWRLQFDDDSTIWESVDGPYVIGVGGTTDVTLRCQTEGTIEAAPSANWTIIDPIVGVTDFESDEQTVLGREAETDGELRARARQEAFRRAQGPLEAVEAQVAAVEGVTYVRAWENTTMETDSDGIPPKAINVVVEGGDPDEVAQAINRGRTGGIQAYGTSENIIVDMGSGRQINIGFDRVSDIDVWVRCTLTTSTSEEVASPNMTSVVLAAISEYLSNLEIGEDVLPYRISGAVYEQGLSGIDAISVQLSLNGVVYSSGKVSISLRSRAVEAGITILTN